MSAVAAATPTRRPWTTSRLLAWSLLVATVSLSAVGAALVLITLDVSVPDNWGFRGYWDILAPIFATAGLFIALRHPHNAIGWILLVSGFTTGFGGFAQEYATYAVLVRPGALPAAVPIAWFASWSFAFFAGPMIMLVPQLFPTGRPLTPRWAPLVGAPLFFIVFSFVDFALRPGPLENASFVDNPIVLSGTLADMRAAVVAPLTLAVFGATLASGASIVLRFRRAQGAERAQLKWMALSGSFVAAAFGLVLSAQASKLAQLLMIVAFTTLPVAIGIAILRYRLYEIDLIIRRTLFYGVLTAAMAGIFAASMALLQRFFVAITGAQSDAAVVLTTLVIVSLFTPVRDSLQRIIDRYFKEPTDAARRIAPYTAELRAFLRLHHAEDIARRLIEEIVRSVGATGGAAFLWNGREEVLLHQVGTETTYVLSLPIGDDTVGRIALAARRGGRSYRPEEIEAVRAALDAAAEAIRLAEARDAR